jgi:hypothetical protein
VLIAHSGPPKWCCIRRKFGFVRHFFEHHAIHHAGRVSTTWLTAAWLRAILVMPVGSCEELFRRSFAACVKEAPQGAAGSRTYNKRKLHA